MKIRFEAVDSELLTPALRAAELLGIEVGEGGRAVTAKKSDALRVKAKGERIDIEYSEKVEFFRALSHIKEHGEDDFEITESRKFRTSGVMIDLSFYEPMTKKAIFEYIDYMAVMGLNTIYLYLEDMYELENRPYFGYMRGRYSYDELKAIDDYAYEYGMEAIPCMQTLGHLEKYLGWSEAGDVRDTANELSVDKEATYKFIEDMLKAATAPFRTKKIHIGLDEAWGLGRGRDTVRKYGFRDQKELFVTHINKVAKIVEKLGLEPMIWNDFLFCLESYHGVDKYDKNTVIPDDIKARMPKSFGLVYWHYGEETMGCDDYMLKKNLEFGNKVIFAGGLLMWQCPLPDNMLSRVATEEGLSAAKANGIENVFTALWCYSHNLCDIMTTLLHIQQYAEHTYCDTVSEEHLKVRFEATTGGEYEAYMNMSHLGNNVTGYETVNHYAKRLYGPKLLWQDVLHGRYETLLEGQSFSLHYSKYAKYYSNLAARGGRLQKMYARCAHIFNVLGRKCYLAENLHKKYVAGDKEFLFKCETELFPELISAVDDLHNSYREMVVTSYKPYGFERLDDKIGSLRARCVTAIYRLKAYREGKIDDLIELSAERLSGF